MITANELRVGNTYMYVRPLSGHGENHHEVTIDENLMGQIFGDTIEFTLNDYEPIDLDYLQLELFGFKRTGNLANNGQPILYENGFYILQQRSNGWLLMDNDFKSLNSFKYMHELQLFHFSITGFEISKIARLITNLKLTEVSILPDGSHGIGFDIID